jgi:hypothetical protein
MAITNVKTFGDPHFDDFDETKNYHRILFRPGFAVQARELTQLQTALQSQIDKLGQYTFADGDRVLGGKQTLLVDNFQYIKLDPTHSNTAISTYLSTFAGKIIQNTAGLQAKVIKVVPAETVGNTAEPDTLYLEYINSGTNKETSVFSQGDVISTTTGTVVSATISSTTGSNPTLNPIGFGSAYAIEEGIFFVNGSFVHTPSELILLDKYTNTPTYIVGLKITDGIKSSLDTGYSDLNDNAQGSPNASAPGANRYVISLNLIKEPIDLANRTVGKYVYLADIKNGIVIRKDDAPIDTQLSDRFEQRTSEESGDYILSPFVLDIKEHRNENNNNGYLTNGDAEKIAIGIEPSIAYIDGRRIEKVATEHVVIDKGRDSSDQRTVVGNTQSIGFGNYIKLDPNNTVETPDVNNFTTLDLHSVVVSGTQSGSNKIGTARARGIEYDSTSTSKHFRLYIFDVTMETGESFASVKSVKQGSFTADLGVRNGSSLVISGIQGTRFETGNNSLVFPLPATAVSSLKDVAGNNFTAAYNVRVKITGQVGSNNSANIPMPSGITLANDDDVVVYLAGASNALEVADTAVGGVGQGVATIAITAANGTAITAIVTGQITAGAVKAKGSVLTKSATLTYSSSQSSYDLGEVDITEIISIIDSANNNVTDKFILDNGQRDSFYDIGKVILKGGAVLPAGNFTVNFKCFQHNTAGNYFSADSYSDYDSIPSYKGVSLRDAIDFRPTKARSGATTGSEFSSGQGPSGCNMIQPVGSISYTLKHYVGRIDKLFLVKDGSYKVVKGKAGLIPVEPQSIENAIHLYNINLRPYVFDVGDIKVTKVDNKRYTMQDIGKLDSRVKRLEYYTSLSLLEKSAKEAQLFDGNGATRFKNGFIVDGFFGHNIGDASHPDYDVSVDKNRGILRPKFDERSINLIRETGDSGTAVKSSKGGIVTMPYTHVTEINQPYSSYSEFVNPYDVVVWDGTIRLSPESDEWKDVDQRPDIIIDDTSAFDQFVTMSEQNGILGTVWNEWETNWTGTTTTGLNVVNDLWIANEGREPNRLTGTVNPNGRGRQDVRTTQNAIVETGTATRTGQDAYVAFDRETKEIGNSVVEVNFIPFMRSRKIYFDAELMKPNTRVYAFFNGVDVTDYCKQESSFVEFTDRSSVITYEDKTQHPSYTNSDKLETNASGRIIGSFVIPRNEQLKFKAGTREFKLTDSATNANDSTTRAAVNFFAQGILETYQRTIVSTKVPRIAYREVSESRTVQRRIQLPEVTRWVDPVAETFLITKKGGIFTTSIDLFFAVKDANIPIHVSIREVENGTPTQREVPGASTVVYPTSINLPTDMTANEGVGNANVATTISWDHPVFLKEGQEYAVVLISNSSEYKVYVAETSKIDLTDSSYQISKQPYNGVFFTSANASTWTPDQTKDLKFKLNRASFTGTSAQINLCNDVVPAKPLEADPFVFISKNSSANTTTVRVLHPNHGMYGSTSNHVVQLSIPSTTSTINGLARSVFVNTTHTITSMEHDSYVIVLPDHENATVADNTRRGGGVGITATENQMYNLTKLSTSIIEFPGDPDTTEDDVKIEFKHTGVTTKSMDGDNDGTQTLYTNASQLPIIANENTQFSYPQAVMSEVNRTGNNLTQQGTYRINATLSNNGIENLSPVIDLNRTSAICVQNRINDATGNADAYTVRGTYQAESNPTGTSNVAKYITKKVELNTDGNNLDIFMDINRPGGTSVDVYYKATDDTDIDFDNIGWTGPILPELPIPVNNTESEYNEAHFNVATGFPFNAFSVKIVLRSANSAYVPTVKNFRAIANT